MSVWVLMVFAALISAAVIAIPAMILKNIFRRGKAGVCTQCGFQGQAKLQTRGSFFIEVVLWLAFIIPGLIYSLWRLSTRHEACPSCGHATMIPLESPRGREIAAQYIPKKA